MIEIFLIVVAIVYAAIVASDWLTAKKDGVLFVEWLIGKLECNYCLIALTGLLTGLLIFDPRVVLIHLVMSITYWYVMKIKK